MWLGLEVVPSLERCPLFIVSFIERLHSSSSSCDALLHVSFLLSGCTVPHLLPPLTAQDADEQAKAVTARSEKIAVEEARCKELADAAQHDLDEALPALEEAVKVCCRCYIPVTAAVRSSLCGG